VVHIFCLFMPRVTNLHSFTSIVTTKDISDESSTLLYWVQHFNARSDCNVCYELPEINKRL